jgi:hypothetical protein
VQRTTAVDVDYIAVSPILQQELNTGHLLAFHGLDQRRFSVIVAQISPGFVG